MELSIISRTVNRLRHAWPAKQRTCGLDSRVLIDCCPEGIVHARNGVIVQVNQALLQAFECMADEIIGRPLTNFLPLRDRAAWLELLEKLRQTQAGEHVEGEFSVRTENGTRRRNVILRLCRAGTGETVASETGTSEAGQLIVFVEDITGLRRSEGALRDHARRLRQLARQVIDVQEAERRHLARELHDEIGQQLTLLKMSLLEARNGQHKGLRQAVEQVEFLTSQVRSLSLDLRPSMLDDLGLVAALRWYVNRTADVTGLVFEAELPGDFPRLSPEAETAFFRVAQEAVNNAVKHAQASQIGLRLSFDTAETLLEISDNGVGFEAVALLQSAHDGSGGGLLGMQERAALVGAAVRITSKPAGGCQVRMRMPHPC